MKRPTIATIAKKFGVSKMTVSRVVNNQEGVSQALRARIQQFIEEMGYLPSASARYLALGKNNLVGILVPDVVSEWIAPLLLGIGEQASALGFQVMLRTTGQGIVAGDNSHEELVESSLTDGLIIASWRFPASFVERLVERGVPVVMVDGYFRSEKVPWVSSAYRSGSSDVLRYLAALGHRKIAFLGGGAGPYVARQQLEGYLAGLAEAGLSPNPAWILQGDYTRESGYRLAAELFGRAERPTAVFAANDPMAVGVLQYAHDQGLNLPRDLSVVGFDDTLGVSTVPPLTSVVRDLRETGRWAMRLLVDQIYQGDDHPEVPQKDLPTRLVVRRSTGAPKEL
jgi:LacI family transcriptional regulator